MIFCVQRITKDCLGYESRVSACFFLKRFGACLVGLFVFDVFVWFGLVGFFCFFVSFFEWGIPFKCRTAVEAVDNGLFLWNLEAGGEDLFILWCKFWCISVKVNSRISQVQLGKVDKVKNGYTETEHAVNS